MVSVKKKSLSSVSLFFMASLFLSLSCAKNIFPAQKTKVEEKNQNGRSDLTKENSMESESEIEAMTFVEFFQYSLDAVRNSIGDADVEIDGIVFNGVQSAIELHLEDDDFEDLNSLTVSELTEHLGVDSDDDAPVSRDDFIEALEYLSQNLSSSAMLLEKTSPNDPCQKPDLDKASWRVNTKGPDGRCMSKVEAQFLELQKKTGSIETGCRNLNYLYATFRKATLNCPYDPRESRASCVHGSDPDSSVIKERSIALYGRLESIATANKYGCRLQIIPRAAPSASPW